MSKYNEVMDNVKVSEDMRNRILANIEKEMSAEVDPASEDTISVKNEIPAEVSKEAGKKASKIVEFRKYAGIAAAFVVLIVGAYAVSRVTPFGGATESSTAMVEEASVSKPKPGKTASTSASKDTADAAMESAEENEAMAEAAYEEISPDAMDTEAAIMTETTTAGAKGESDSVGQASDSMAIAKYKEYASLAKLSKAAGTSFTEIEYLDSFSSGKDYYLYDGNIAAISYDVEGNTVIVREMDAKLGDIIPTNVGVSTADLVTDSIKVGDVNVDLFGDEEDSNAALGTQLFYIAQWTKDGLVYQLESSEALTYEDMKELMEQIVNS